jgi:predicted N-acetyltransferase YhbS
MKFLPLTIERLQFRLAEDPEAVTGWFEARMQDYLTYDPKGSFAVEENGRMIGMVTTACYRQTGWIGWLYVTPSEWGHGLGAAIMKRAIDHIQSRGMKTVLLEAVVEAVSLYKRLGFVPQFNTQHYQLSAPAKDSAGEGGVTTVPIEKYPMTKLFAFDRRFFHDDRSRLLNVVMKNPLFKGFVAERDNRTVGYIAGTESKVSRQVGPFIVERDVDGDGAVRRALIREMLYQAAKPLYFRCPLVDPDRAAPLLAEGAQKVDYHTVRMYLGDPYSVEQPGVLSLGCPGKG